MTTDHTTIGYDTASRTIVAISTPPGTGGIAVVRISGHNAITIAEAAWRGPRTLLSLKGYQCTYGEITDASGETIDQAVATVFKAPHSFTGEDTVELSVHGSTWIQRNVVNRLIELGASPAEPGEYTRRAFLNGRMDLAQAEGVADLIAASSKAAHRLAMSQAKGNFSQRLETLRQRLIDFASMLELELDFSEEDVEFADRTKLTELATEVKKAVDRLASTFATGQTFKNGVPVAIAGIPNAGKSTLLNMLLDDDKAIVSEIPGTTRDIIEDTREIGGILFRLADTAGLRDTADTVEAIGVDRARNRLSTASIVLWVIDPIADTTSQIDQLMQHLASRPEGQHIIAVINKTDSATPDVIEHIRKTIHTSDNSGDIHIDGIAEISARKGDGLTELENLLTQLATSDHNPDAELIVTNARHHASLRAASTALSRALTSLSTSLSADFIAQDVREAIHHLSSITGAITTDTLLHTIFSRFCIGK